MLAGPDVIQVALLDPATAPRGLAAPPPAPEPTVEKQTVAPNEDTGVRLTPPKPKPKPKRAVEPEKNEPPPEPTPAPALPYASVGNAGLRGAVAVDAAD